MQFKSLSVERIDETGKGLARIARLSVVDNDGDTYAKGAFSWKKDGGQWVQMIPAHDRKAMPFGKAWVYEDGDWAMAEFQLNLNTQAGKEWHEALKFDLATGTPVQEWSYGFNTLDAAKEMRGNKQVRVLKQLDVDEISPVIRGAGVGTGTVAVKSAELKEARFAELIAALGEMGSALGDNPQALSATGIKQLTEIRAALDGALNQLATDPGADQDDGDQKAAAELAAHEALGGYLEMLSRAALRSR